MDPLGLGSNETDFGENTEGSGCFQHEILVEISLLNEGERIPYRVHMLEPPRKPILRDTGDDGMYSPSLIRKVTVEPGLPSASGS